MLMNLNWQYAVIWEFCVKSEAQLEFEQAYGPRGDWVQLFRRATGYVGTDLLRDKTSRNRYVTIDLWRSLEDYAALRQQHAEEYREIEQRCEQMTETEQALGTFERILR